VINTSMNARESSGTYGPLEGRTHLKADALLKEPVKGSFQPTAVLAILQLLWSGHLSASPAKSAG
jgi:hypothetical protein